jgi:hypothetical protein
MAVIAIQEGGHPEFGVFAQYHYSDGDGGGYDRAGAVEELAVAEAARRGRRLPDAIRIDLYPIRSYGEKQFLRAGEQAAAIVRHFCG